MVRSSTAVLARRSVCMSAPFTPSLLTRSLATALVLCSGAAQAFQVDTGSSDFSLRWDNTAKYSAAWRTQDPSRKLSESTVARNQDDGDRNFEKGLISNRLDILSELDMSFQNVGARLSGAAWYDTEYQSSNDNDNPARSNQRSGRTTNSPTTPATCTAAMASCWMPSCTGTATWPTARCRYGRGVTG